MQTVEEALADMWDAIITIVIFVLIGLYCWGLFYVISHFIVKYW